MTHDELVAKINKELEITHWEAWHEGARALLAVVEMHRPALDSEMSEFSDNEIPGCAGCGFDYDYSTWETNYPCPTIQAIVGVMYDA